MRASIRWSAAAAALVLVGAVPSQVRAQRGSRIVGGVEYQSMSFDSGLGTKAVTVLAVPIGWVWSPSNRLTVDVGTRFASATRDDENGTSASLSGLTDTQVRAVYSLRPDVAVLTLSATLPTGQTELAGDEVLVAGALASDLLPFPVSSFGSGLNVTTGLAVAVPVGGWAVGLGGSYRVSSGFKPVAGLADYKAGGEVRLRLGLDRVVGQGRVSLGFTYSSFASDEFGGTAVYRPGRHYITQAAWSVPVGNMGLSLYAWDLYRASGVAAGTQTPTNRENVFTVGTGLTVSMGRNQLRPSIEYRLLNQGASSLDAAGSLLTVGARYVWRVGNRWTLLPALRWNTGAITNAGSDIGFTGLNAGLALRASW